jgi:hypothetical protein
MCRSNRSLTVAAHNRPAFNGGIKRWPDRCRNADICRRHQKILPLVTGSILKGMQELSSIRRPACPTLLDGEIKKNLRTPYAVRTHFQLPENGVSRDPALQNSINPGSRPAMLSVQQDARVLPRGGTGGRDLSHVGQTANSILARRLLAQCTRTIADSSVLNAPASSRRLSITSIETSNFRAGSTTEGARTGRCRRRSSGSKRCGTSNRRAPWWHAVSKLGSSGSFRHWSRRATLLLVKERVSDLVRQGQSPPDAHFRQVDKVALKIDTDPPPGTGLITASGIISRSSIEMTPPASASLDFHA